MSDLLKERQDSKISTNTSTSDDMLDSETVYDSEYMAMGRMSSRGVDRYFNNVLSIVSAVALLVLFYLNYRMFETYIGEFIFAFVFSEALWDTKVNLTEWLEKVNSLALTSNSEFSLRNELFNKLRDWASIFRPRRILHLQRDLSGAYMQLGVLVTAFVIRPTMCFNLVLFLLGLLLIITIFNNKLLFLFRLHVYCGISHDYLVASFLVGGMLCISALLALAFGILISRDINLLRVETTLFVESHVLDEESIVHYIVTNGVTALKPFLDQKNDYIEATIEDMPGIRALVNAALRFFESITEPQSMNITIDTHELPEEMCLADLNTSFTGVVAYLRCLQEDIMSIPWQSFLPSFSMDMVPNLFLQGSSIIAMTTTLPLVLMDIGFRLLFFITILFLLLSSKETALQSFLKTFTTSRPERGNLLMVFEKEMQRSMEAILIIPIRMSLLNAMATIMVMVLFDLNARYLCATTVFFFSMFPLVVPSLVIIPWLLFYVAAYNMTWVEAFYILVFHFVCHYVVQTWALMGLSEKTNSGTNEEENGDNGSATEETTHSNSSTVGGKREYITTLAIFFGMVTFGAKGIVLGPFLFCLVMIAQKVYLSYKLLSVNANALEPRKRFATPGRRRRSSTKSKELTSFGLDDEQISRALREKRTNNETRLRKTLSTMPSFGGSQQNIEALAKGFANISRSSPRASSNAFSRRNRRKTGKSDFGLGLAAEPSPTAELHKIYEMYQNNALTKSEFELIKKRILKRL